MTTYNKERSEIVMSLINKLYITKIEPGVLTVSDICEELDVSRATFYNWRKGSAAPLIGSFEKLLALADM